MHTSPYERTWSEHPYVTGVGASDTSGHSPEMPHRRRDGVFSGRSRGAVYMMRARAHRLLAKLLGSASQFLSAP